MPQFAVNPQRVDPYKNFKFLIKWDGKYVAGMSKMTSLKQTTEVVKHRAGGDPVQVTSLLVERNMRPSHSKEA